VHWRQLVTAVMVWRMLHPTDSNDPLGESLESSELFPQWTALHDALALFQCSRIQQRLTDIRALRGAESVHHDSPPASAHRRARQPVEGEQRHLSDQPMGSRRVPGNG
jgi:hypothetical protein